MLPALLAVLFQSGLAAPQAGFLRADDGRLYPLYGMQGTFLLGAALDPDVIAAARFGSLLVEKTGLELRIIEEGRHYSAETKGHASFAWDSATRTLYVWLAEERRLLRFANGAFSYSPLRAPDGEIAAISARKGQLRWLVRQAGGPRETFDSEGNLWTASDFEVSCGGRRWSFDHPVHSVDALGEGWALLRTRTGRYAARCNGEDVFEIPSPETP